MLLWASSFLRTTLYAIKRCISKTATVRSSKRRACSVFLYPQIFFTDENPARAHLCKHASRFACAGAAPLDPAMQNAQGLPGVGCGDLSSSHADHQPCRWQKRGSRRCLQGCVSPDGCRWPSVRFSAQARGGGATGFCA